MKPAYILFFIEDSAPTAEDYAEAAKINGKVVFRNASRVPNEPHSLEVCDGVAGAVPKIYADAFPSAEEAVAKKAEELAALTSKVGDEPAPVLNQKGPQAPVKGQAGAKQTWNPQPQ